MALTPEHQIASRLKRRQAVVHGLGIFLGAFSVVATTFFLGRLVKKRLADRSLREVAVQKEQEAYFRQREHDTMTARIPEPAPVAPTRPLRPITFVDMTRRDAGSAVLEALSAPQTAAPIPPAPGGDPVAPAGSVGIGRYPASWRVEGLERKIAAISDILKEYFEAGTVTQMLPLVRDARRVRPLMEEYYQRHPIAPRSWKGVSRAIPVAEPGFRLAYVTAQFQDPQDQTDVIVEETDVGFLLDWESTVRYSELDWKEFLAKKPAEPKFFRLLATRVEDVPGGGTVVRLERPQEKGAVLGRFDPADPRFRPLVQQLELCNGKDAPVILRLCYPGSSAAENEVDIAGVEGKGWIILGDHPRGS